MADLIPTTRFVRRRLPHWEVQGGRYFVTVRCGDSLPPAVVVRLAEIHHTLAAIDPRSDGFASLQRQYFQTMEKHLDAGIGAAPLRDPRAAAILVDAFANPETDDVTIPHFTVMPNHCHALIAPRAGQHIELHPLIARLKGRTARAINLAIGRTGPLWQREWFDRWVRNEAEWERLVAYIKNNPVKAGLVEAGCLHPWTR